MKALWRSGEPFVWLTGGALAVALIMVAGLVGIIVVSALGFFWPATVVRVTLRDGKVLTGPIAARERVPGKAGEYRIKVRVANRDLYGEDFVWADEARIARRELPTDVVVVERTEWGWLIGTVKEIREGGTAIASPGIRELRRRLPEAGRLRGDIRRIERGDIGAINHEQEHVRLRLRRLELEGVTSGPDVEALQARMAALQTRYTTQEARLAALRQGQTAVVVIAADGGKEKALPIAQVVDVYAPNTMSAGASFTTPVIMSGATSPAARAIARMSPVRIDGMTAGSTTRRVVSSLVAPSASEASRVPRGMAASPSSVATMTTGMVRSASVSDAHRMPPVPKVGVGSASGKNRRSIDPPTK